MFANQWPQWLQHISHKYNVDVREGTLILRLKRLRVTRISGYNSFNLWANLYKYK